MEYKKIISGTAAAILAVSLLGSCGKVEIQQKKEKSSATTTTTAFSFDELIDSETTSSNKQMSGIVPTPVLDDDDIAGTVSQTTTKKAVTTTTVKQIIPATTTKPTITTTPRATTTTTTTTRASTTSNPTFSTNSTTTSTTSKTTTTTTTTISTLAPTQPTQQNPTQSEPPAPDTVSVTAAPNPGPSNNNALAGRNKLNIGGGSAGLGDSFSGNSGYFGSQSGTSQWTNANGRTVTEHYYGDVVVAETDGVISYIEISGDSTASTSNGLQTGMTLSQMEAICGTNYYVEDNCQYTYYDGNVSLSVLVIDDEVIKIEVCDNGMY